MSQEGLVTRRCVRVLCGIPLLILFLPSVLFAQAGNFSAGVNYIVPLPGSGGALYPTEEGAAIGAFVTSSKVPDIVNADADSTVSIWVGNGDGTFQARYTVTAVPSTGTYSGYVTEAVAVGDFNGDGNLDLAVICLNPSGSNPNTSGTVNILLGDGTGHFGAPTVIPLDGSYPAQVLAGDFNNDSKLNLAVLNKGSESITILLGNGDGTFTALPDTSIALPGTSVMVAADFNKDGNLDLAVMNQDGIGVLLGKSDGTFQPVVNWLLATNAGGGGTPGGLVVGDFNNDGNLDMATTDTGIGVNVFLGQGDGTFQNPLTSLPYGGFPLLATADFNSDGSLDLAGASFNEVALALGNGKGSFTADAYSAPVSTYGNVYQTVTADLNGDGFPDLVVWSNNGVTPDGVITVMLNCGLRCTNTAVTLPTPASVFGQPVNFTATVTPANAKATGTPTGTVTFQASTIVTGGNTPVTTTLGNATLSGGIGTLTYSGLAPGQYTISADYQGDANFNSSTSTAEPAQPEQTVGETPTGTSLTSSPNPSTPGQTVTFVATVTSSPSGAPTGTVTFEDNGNDLVSQPLSSNGTATVTVSSALSSGANTIEAIYSGDSNFASSTSSALSQIVQTSATPFAISAVQKSATISAGKSWVSTIVLAAIPSFKSAVSFSCSGLPIGANCSFAPPQVTPTGASAVTTLTISTTGSGSVFDMFRDSPRWPGPALPFAFLGLIVLAILAVTRKQQAQRPALPVLVLLGVFVMLTGVFACGGNSSPQNVTPHGTSQITVTASANGQSATTNISLTVN